MKNNEKLKIVFDFIADYLSEEETIQIETPKETPKEESKEIEFTEDDEIVETPFSDSLKRAYKLMKTMEDKDKENAIIKQQVKQIVNPIKEELNRVKAEYAEKILKDERGEGSETTEEPKERPKRYGATLNDEGSLVMVEVPHLNTEGNDDELISKNKKEVLEAFEEKLKETEAQVKTTKIKRKPKK